MTSTNRETTIRDRILNQRPPSRSKSHSNQRAKSQLPYETVAYPALLSLYPISVFHKPPLSAVVTRGFLASAHFFDVVLIPVRGPLSSQQDDGPRRLPLRHCSLNSPRHSHRSSFATPTPLLCVHPSLGSISTVHWYVANPLPRRFTLFLQVRPRVASPDCFTPSAAYTIAHWC